MSDEGQAAGDARCPVLSTLLKLALPTVVVLSWQTLCRVAETYFVSFLGTEPLPASAWCFRSSC